MAIRQVQTNRTRFVIQGDIYMELSRKRDSFKSGEMAPHIPTSPHSKVQCCDEPSRAQKKEKENYG